MILAEPPVPESNEALPPYTPIPYTPFRRVTHDGTLSGPIDARTLRSQEARNRELRSLQRQWTVRRRSYPGTATPQPQTERTRYRPLVSEAFDLPPPYAPADPYPLFGPEPRRASRVARVLLCPFVPGGPMLERAAGRTDRWAKQVRWRVRTGVREVGCKARAVPGRIGGERGRRKMGWRRGGV